MGQATPHDRQQRVGRDPAHVRQAPSTPSRRCASASIRRSCTAIDAINAFVYERVSNGVYRCGFAGSQAAYERAFDRLFAALDELDARLGRSRFLVAERGDAPTEADWRLFTTLVRFDAVYHGHFKVQTEARCRLSFADAPVAGVGRGARRCGHGEHGPHQAPLLRQPPAPNPSGIVPRGRRSTSCSSSN
ncbi:MAG: glutathione S-transferase C-terminal domain-containing protein [Rubrivivax sp.]